MRRRRGLVTRWEVLIALIITAASAAWATPRVQRMTWRTRRAEVPWVLESLRAAASESGDVTRAWVARGAIPQALEHVGLHQVPFPADLPGGWRPPLELARGAYRVQTSDEGIKVIGTCDVDGDGVRAVYVVTSQGAIVQQTPEDVY